MAPLTTALSSLSARAQGFARLLTLTFTGTPSTFIASTLSTSTYWGCIGWGNGLFIALSGNTNSGSFDGINWFTVTLPLNAGWGGIAYGNGHFVTVAGGPGTFAAYSTNGTTWTNSTLPSSQIWVDAAYGLVGATPYFVAIAQTSAVAAYSTNATTWSSATLPSSTNWTSVTYGNGYFVAVTGATTAGAYSTNGTTWTASTGTATFSQDVAYGLVGSTPTFVAVFNPTSAYSTNGSSWNAMTMPGSSNFAGVAFGNGYFVATGYGGSVGAYSTNGTTWTANNIIISGASYHPIAYGSGVFAVIPQGLSVNTSSYFAFTRNYS